MTTDFNDTIDFGGDELEALIAAPARVAPAVPAQEPALHWQNCWKCNGRGVYGHFGTCFAECVDGLHHGSTRRRRVLDSQDAATCHVRTFDAALETVGLAFLAYDERVELAS